MKIEKFEDVIAWQKAKELVLDLYKILDNCRDFNFKNQILRAAISIMNNIAEGFERRTNKELINFLFIAKGSCGEVRSMLSLGLELKCISQNDYEHISILSMEVSKILSGFIKAL